MTQPNAVDVVTHRCNGRPGKISNVFTKNKLLFTGGKCWFAIFAIQYGHFRAHKFVGLNGFTKLANIFIKGRRSNRGGNIRRTLSIITFEGLLDNSIELIYRMN